MFVELCVAGFSNGGAAATIWEAIMSIYRETTGRA